MNRKIYYNTLLILIIFSSLLILISCERDEPKKAKYEIIGTTTGMKSYGSPFITITVKNTGNATGYNVACDVQAKKGSLIVDSGFAYFANGSDISPGESAKDEAIFFNLDSHNDYDKLEYDLDWLTK